MAKNIPIMIGVTALAASVAAFFVLHQQISPLESDLASAKQTLVSTQKENIKHQDTNNSKDEKPNDSSVLKISADAAYASYQSAAQKYLDAYIKESSKVKAPLQNVDQNEVMAPLAVAFGANGVPDTETSDNSPAHLLFEPYAYRNPVMEFSALTPHGDGVFNGRLTVKSEGIKPIEIDFSYDTHTNLISKLNAFTEKDSNKPNTDNPNDDTSGVPTNPIFPNVDEN